MTNHEFIANYLVQHGGRALMRDVRRALCDERNKPHTYYTTYFDTCSSDSAIYCVGGTPQEPHGSYFNPLNRKYWKKIATKRGTMIVLLKNGRALVKGGGA